MLFEPSAGMFGPSKCGKKASDEAIKAFYLHYRNNPENKEEYNVLKKKYGCYMTEKEALAAFKELGIKERIRQAKEGFAAQEAERGYDGLKPMHPLLREFEESAGKKKKKRSHEIPPSWHGSLVGGNCKKPSDEEVIKWWKYYHLRKSASDQYDAAYRKRHAKAEKKAFDNLKSAKKCGIRKTAVDKLIKKVPKEKREAAGIELK
jgi:hypothetical protein